MDESISQITDQTERELTRIAVRHQSEGRIPGLFAGVARAGALRWTAGVGAADLANPDAVPDADTQYPIASNTKTFVAVMVMQLRDEGRLRLDDTVEHHLADSSQPDVTIRQLLAHTTGMAREPVGDVWDTLRFPDRDELVPGWNRAERVGRQHTRWHYSNLGYSILGEIIARLDGREWQESLQQRLLDPLGLRRTTLGPTEPVAGGYFVPPFTDVPLTEPPIELGALAPAGGLYSTAVDLATWHGFLADPVAQILDPDTVQEMTEPQIIADTTGWTSAWGLGLMLVRRDGKIWVGHTGGFPGSITGVFTERESSTTGLILMNNSAAPDPAAIATELGSYLLEHEPPLVQHWTPGTELPDELVPLLGRWFSEGRGFTFSIAGGRLEARVDRAPATVPPSVFERIADDEFRTVSGRERGERLVVDRHSDGTVRQLNWATYRFTREPLAFNDVLPRR